MNALKEAAGELCRRLGQMPIRYRIICFDMDKTLLNSSNTHIAAWHTAASQTNQQFPDDPPIRITPEFEHGQDGISNDDAVRLLNLDPNSEKGRMLIGFKKRAAVAGVSQARWFDNAVAALPVLHSRGYKLRIVTSSQRELVERVLEAQPSLKLLLSSITGREDYPRGKPYPDCLIAAATASGLDVADVLYVGDHPVDYQCTRNAGCAFLLYSPNGEPDDQTLKGVPSVTTHLDIWRYL
jgi:phosphoglycolate phosphatase-like HAD superfamily hydrolase